MTDKNTSTPHKQILTALLATIPTLSYGIQIGWLSPMGPLLKSPSTPAPEPVTDSAISWMAAALPLSGIIGVAIFSFCSDRFGRKKCIIALSVLSTISWAIKLTLPDTTPLICARVFGGLSAGGSLVVIPVYIKEISEDCWRGNLGSLVMTLCKLGVVVVYVMGSVASYYVNQSVYLAIAVSHAIVFKFMPESPVFLVRRGLEKQATETIAWLRNLRQTDKQITDEIARYKREEQTLLELPTVTIATVVRDRQAFSALRMVLTLMAVQTLSGSFALMNYASDVFTRAGTEWSPNTLAIIVGSIQLGGSFLTTMTIEKFGRKIPLATSSFLVGICMSVLATYFLLENELPTWLPVIAVCVCIFSYAAGLAPVPFVVMAEVFTFQLRAKLAGVSMVLSFLCSSTTVLFYTPIANLFGPYAVFYTFSLVGILGGFYVVFYVPETSGKSLEEIQKFWKKDEPQPTPV